MATAGGDGFGPAAEMKLQIQIQHHTKPLAETVQALSKSHRVLMQKISDLESKVKDLSGRLHRSQVVRKAIRVQKAMRARQGRLDHDGKKKDSGPSARRNVTKLPKKLTSKRELRLILRDPQGFTAFHKFCVKQTCGENPVFWKKCNDFIDECTCTLEDIAQLEQAGMDPSELFAPPNTPDPSLQVAKTIFFDFIVAGSPNEVSVSKVLVTRITKGVHKLLRIQNKSTLVEHGNGYALSEFLFSFGMI
mmetsp:Transcript_42526/g.68527  ORF Transcript_42526/g.68527 Transcript_42526/m.68527 type:complete len:248 (-) Transcript_42526:130-873(-)